MWNLFKSHCHRHVLRCKGIDTIMFDARYGTSLTKIISISRYILHFPTIPSNYVIIQGYDSCYFQCSWAKIIVVIVQMVDIVLALPLFCFAKLFELDHVKLTFFNFPMKSSSLVVLSGYEVAIILGSEVFFTQKFLKYHIRKNWKALSCVPWICIMLDWYRNQTEWQFTEADVLYMHILWAVYSSHIVWGFHN